MIAKNETNQLKAPVTMKFLYFEEMLRLLFKQCQKNPKLFVSVFDNSDCLIGFNYCCSSQNFTHASYSFQKILGYDLANILSNTNFSLKIIHPQDKMALEDSLINVSNEDEIKSIPFKTNPVKFRGRHVKGYWKYFTLISIDYWCGITNTYSKVGLIADERIKSQLPFAAKKLNNIIISNQQGQKFPNSEDTGYNTISVSPRESEILEMLSEGKIAKEIADDLSISLSTVITHRKNLISKFNVHNTAELIKVTTRLMLI